MNQEMLSLGLDIVIAVLLCATIVYAYMLNKRLQALRADREEMENLLRKFYDATNKADASIKGLKQTSEVMGGELQEKIDKARSLRDEITFMLERGDLLANQLEGAISASRTERPGQDLSGLMNKAAQNMEKKSKTKDLRNLENIFTEEAEGQSAVEKELLKALKGLR
ncbi:MAG: hypothetical protein EYC62_01440 [Alphaproteobacteria bacterium]|nr:MAG: hypothetical protein EYC62_01440 [Alphaproteobacteria bacterium]